MQREQLLTNVMRELSAEGFSQQPCLSTQSCFDIAARRDTLLLIKVLENIDGLSAMQAENLRKASSILSAQDFLIGEHSMAYPLENGVLYERHHIPASNFSTFRGILNNEQPLVRKFNRLTCDVDGSKLAQARKESNLTLDDLSAKAGISRETLYRYEHNLTSATPENLTKLEQIFSRKLSQPQPISRHPKVPTFDFHGLLSVRVRSPFELVGKERTSQIGKRSDGTRNDTIAFSGECDLRTAAKRAVLYSGLADILRTHICFLMRESKRDSIADIPVIRKEELAEIRKPRELIKLIDERSS